MKIIIPMAGKGNRFNEVYFHTPKPLLEIDGKPMIEHVVNLFSTEDEFVFICNQEHLQKTRLREVLMAIAKNCKIISAMDEQIKGGPLYTCSLAFDFIGDQEELIVNYCDFTMVWDYQHFLKTVRKNNCSGAIPSFKGFHPASLGDTYYAYLKNDPDGYLTELREKEPFSSERSKDYASTGTYYFTTGAIFKKYCKEVMKLGMSVKGEAYVTLPYILMIRDGHNVLNYEVEKFICLGTARDYEIYKFWSEFFFKHSGQVVGFNNVNIKTTNIFPLAGDKREFQALGLNQPNFLIPLMDKPLVTSTVKSYPKGIRNIFICLEEHRQKYQLDLILHNIFLNSEIIYLDNITGGNAQTILHSRSLVSNDEPVCISGCSYILDYDERKLSYLIEDKSIDVILLSFTHHECVLRNPHHHSYLQQEHGLVKYISEKRVISNFPYRDHAFTGTVIYRRSQDLFNSITKSLNDPPNPPSFLTAINELISEGKKVVIFEVDKFISLLNQLDYQEFLYWQDYFDKLEYHPYSKQIN